MCTIVCAAECYDLSDNVNDVVCEFVASVMRDVLCNVVCIRYVVRLYDGLHKKWKRVKIDDYIPCHKDSGQPIFAKPNDRELWCLLFEKAVAKLMGGYVGERLC